MAVYKISTKKRIAFISVILIGLCAFLISLPVTILWNVFFDFDRFSILNMIFLLNEWDQVVLGPFLITLSFFKNIFVGSRNIKEIVVWGIFVIFFLISVVLIFRSIKKIFLITNKERRIKISPYIYLFIGYLLWFWLGSFVTLMSII